MGLPVLTLDTNILVSAFRSSRGASFRLMEMLAEEKFEIGVTTPLILEYESVCKRLIGSTHVTSDDVDHLIDYLCQIGRRSIVYYRVRPSVNDPDDEMVLEAAIASRSNWIVTYNLRDLLVGASRYGIEVITPADAIHKLGVRYEVDSN